MKMMCCISFLQLFRWERIGRNIHLKPFNNARKLDLTQLRICGAIEISQSKQHVHFWDSHVLLSVVSY